MLPRPCPIIATPGVDSVIRCDDPIKEEIERPTFGEEWPAQRAFPSQIVEDGSELSWQVSWRRCPDSMYR